MRRRRRPRKPGGKTDRRVEDYLEVWDKENPPWFPNSGRDLGFGRLLLGFGLFPCISMGSILGFLRAFR